MTKDEMIAKFVSIGSSTDDAERRALITEVQSDLEFVYDTNEMLRKTNEDNETTIKQLQDYNRQLYMKISVPQTQADPQPPQTEDKPRLKFEDLFK